LSSNKKLKRTKKTLVKNLVFHQRRLPSRNLNNRNRRSLLNNPNLLKLLLQLQSKRRRKRNLSRKRRKLPRRLLILTISLKTKMNQSLQYPRCPTSRKRRMIRRRFQLQSKRKWLRRR
jgi:hypothetical protein